MLAECLSFNHRNHIRMYLDFSIEYLKDTHDNLGILKKYTEFEKKTLSRYNSYDSIILFLFTINRICTFF